MKYLGAISNDYDMVNKKYVDDAVAGAGGGGDKVFVVTYDDTGSTPTPSANELSAAVEAGKAVFCYDTSGNRMLSLTYYSTVDGEYFFVSVPDDAGYVRWISYAYDSWDETGYFYLVSKSNLPATNWYGTCSTTASTAAKAVTINNFTLSDFKAGTIIGILFTTANTAATPTLNINSLSATTIYVGSSTINSTTTVLKWSANTMVYFMYDGNYFRYMYATAAASVTQPRGANTWYGTASTAAATQAKTSTIDNFVLTKGVIAVINFTYGNAYNGKITLNINSTGAKDVYYKNAITSTTNKPLWKANSCVTFVYSGSYYYIVNITPSPSDEEYDSWQVNVSPQDQDLRVVLGLDPTGQDATTLDSAIENIWGDTKYCYAQARGTGSAITATESGVITQVALSTIEKSYGGYFTISDGGIQVPISGTYRISGSVYGRAHNVTESGATASSIYNANFGCYLKAGTSFATSSEILGNWWPHCGASGHCVGPVMYDLNANDIVYLSFRSRTAACNVSPSDKATYLLVEKMP